MVFFASRFGITEEQIAATVNNSAESPCWSAKDSLLVRLVDELHDSARISDDLWQDLSKNWQPPQLIEFIVLAGLYHMVSFVVNSLRIELEEGAARFPAR